MANRLFGPGSFSRNGGSNYSEQAMIVAILSRATRLVGG